MPDPGRIRSAPRAFADAPDQAAEGLAGPRLDLARHWSAEDQEESA